MANLRYNWDRRQPTLGASKSKIACLTCGCLVGLTAAYVGVYLGIGALGWNLIKNKVVYEDKYWKAAKLADQNRDGNLDELECKVWFDDMGITKLQEEKWSEVKPSFKALEDYIDNKEE
ncbi:hypothetical protein HY643_05140 [Candidatus Woesearchaeota archaeon]|nr:hypothetical protein [Candidatus Woesearchaeota archaeon]